MVQGTPDSKLGGWWFVSLIFYETGALFERIGE